MAPKRVLEEEAALIVDSTALRNMWFDVCPSLMAKDFKKTVMTHKGTMSYLSLFEEMAILDIKVIIPETVIFEVVGQDKDGIQIDPIFRQKDARWPTLNFFFRQIANGKIPGAEIRTTASTKGYMDGLKKIAKAKSQYSGPKLRNFIRDYGQDVGENAMIELAKQHDGPVFFMSGDRGARNHAMHTITNYGYSIGVLNAMGFIHTMDRKGLLQEIGFKTGVGFDDVRKDITKKLTDSAERRGRHSYHHQSLSDVHFRGEVGKHPRLTFNEYLRLLLGKGDVDVHMPDEKAESNPSKNLEKPKLSIG